MGVRAVDAVILIVGGLVDGNDSEARSEIDRNVALTEWHSSLTSEEEQGGEEGVGDENAEEGDNDGARGGESDAFSAAGDI